MTPHPHLDAFLAAIERHPFDSTFTVSSAFAANSNLSDLARELRALFAVEERLAALTAPPERRLREHKGVAYRDGEWWWCDTPWPTAAMLIHYKSNTFTDDDHAALLALKAQPYEAAEDKVVERVARFARETENEWNDAAYGIALEKCAADLRAIMRAEGGGA